MTAFEEAQNDLDETETSDFCTWQLEKNEITPEECNGYGCVDLRTTFLAEKAGVKRRHKEKEKDRPLKESHSATETPAGKPSPRSSINNEQHLQTSSLCCRRSPPSPCSSLRRTLSFFAYFRTCSRYLAQDDHENRRAFWVDASVLEPGADGTTAAAVTVVNKQNGKSSECILRAYPKLWVERIGTHAAEGLAIAKALQIALKDARKRVQAFQVESADNSDVLLYSDSVAALTTIRDFQPAKQQTEQYGGLPPDVQHCRTEAGAD